MKYTNVLKNLTFSDDDDDDNDDDDDDDDDDDYGIWREKTLLLIRGPSEIIDG